MKKLLFIFSILLLLYASCDGIFSTSMFSLLDRKGQIIPDAINKAEALQLLEIARSNSDVNLATQLIPKINTLVKDGALSTDDLVIMKEAAAEAAIIACGVYSGVFKTFMALSSFGSTPPTQEQFISIYETLHTAVLLDTNAKIAFTNLATITVTQKNAKIIGFVGIAMMASKIPLNPDMTEILQLQIDSDYINGNGALTAAINSLGATNPEATIFVAMKALLWPGP